MSSLEAHQEQPLSSQEHRLWVFHIKQAVLCALQSMEVLYVPEEERELRKKTPLTNERYQQWLGWMYDMDEDPSILFKNHRFVDEGALAENIRILMRGMEALEELQSGKRPSPSTQERLGLPSVLRYIPLEKLTFYQLIIGGKAAGLLEDELEAQGFEISDPARFVLGHPAFEVAEYPEQIDLVRLKVGDLFDDENEHTTQELYQKAAELGLELCPAEVGPHFRLLYKHQLPDERIRVAMKSLAGPDGMPHIFRIERSEGDLILAAYWVRPDSDWDPESMFVFRLRATDTKDSSS